MNYNDKEILKFIEPILHFCIKGLNNLHDAEDLTSEIIVHVLSGIRKYEIESLEKWIWSIAHNRYSKFIDKRNKTYNVEVENDYEEIADTYDFVDKLIISDNYHNIFKALHSLSSKYHDIFTDYYIKEFSIKQIAEKYKLSETTVKWRLNVGRKKIKEKIVEINTGASKINQ
jgi:RNA polymerase sigma factor (sigma-70 family)